MALELFKPFIYHRLEQTGNCTTSSSQRDGRAADPMLDILKKHQRPSVMLNRAYLHRLAYRRLSRCGGSKAIKIHPLVCTAFNADFDGDQMAVHIPLSPERRSKPAS